MQGFRLIAVRTNEV